MKLKIENKLTTMFLLVSMGFFVQTLNAYEDREELTKEEHRTKILQKFDKNEDNRISRDEARGGMKRNFERHDLNGDGYIEGDELDTLPRHPRGEHKKGKHNEDKQRE